ncbi:MAG TPA: NAD(P)-dependent oxidoreductase [Candidatus Gastranaerophilaceae bacterium]|nr:NAD(P)-dependent oxidoreductase [Candidatus Gastranaerophilaceae bacterium]
MKIVFFDIREDETEAFGALCKGERKGKCQIECTCKMLKETLNEQTVLTDEIKQAEVISCFTFSRVTENVLKQFPNLKLIALRCVGFNHIDVEYCRKNNIQVLNSFGYGNITVAEFAFALLFDVSRKVTRAYINLKEGELSKDFYTGFELNGKTIGIIGTGAIGTQAIRIAKGFGMNVLGYDPFPKKELVEKYQVKYVELDELLKNSDVVSLHSPLTEDNFHLINEEKINLMKSTAVLINTARGELIDSKALYGALSENRILGAGLDVLEAENMITQPDTILDFDYLTDDYIRQTLINERLLKLHNVVVTPHIAYNSKEAKERIVSITMDNIDKFFQGEIQNSVL